MDTLEVITADISLDDEVDFFTFVSRNREVRVISTKVTAGGPIELSAQELQRLRRSEYGKGQDVLLWNTRILKPLCWSLSLVHYDSDWELTDPRQARSSPFPRTTEDLIAAHTSFRRRSITQQLLQHGRIDQVLSPVLEVSMPSGTKGGLFSVTAHFSSYVHGVWLTWNTTDGTWQHEARDFSQILQEECEQPTEFIEWQEEIFDWVRGNWPNWIIPRYTYRLGSGDPQESLGRLAQSLADLLGKRVAGFDPQPPIVRPGTD